MVLLRILHPVQTFNRKTPHSRTAIKEKQEVVDKSLISIKSSCGMFQKIFKKEFEDTLHNLTTNLLEFIKSSHTTNLICTWSRDDIPSEECGDNWSIINNRLDLMIEKRVTEALMKWENDTKYTRLSQTKLYSLVKSYTAIVGKDLEEVEKHIRGSTDEAKNYKGIESHHKSKLQIQCSLSKQGERHRRIVQQFQIINFWKYKICPTAAKI